MNDESKFFVGSTDGNIGAKKPSKSVQPQNSQEIPKEFIDNEFEILTDEVELPSKGVFYPNGKKSVTVKYLTAEEDDILFSPELLKSGRVLDALLQTVVVDKDINSEDMLVGDRNAILIHVRKIGMGEEYSFGNITCPSCERPFAPVVNLDELKLNYLKDKPDERGEYDFLMPLMKKNIKFRLLNGKDEIRISKATQISQKGKAGNYKISKAITERYKLQIMEVEGNRDKLYISKFVSAMPMRDSLVFREYVKRISPGVDFGYTFQCEHCGHVFEDDVPITYKLFYPDADL
jgi:hypothetical protein